MTALPLAGLTVVEFSQMVMGPCCGLILADLGAEVIKVEPLPKGDRTRALPGLARGFFTAMNRNKRSIALDMTSAEDLAVLKRLIAKADILVENFRPGLMAGMGLGYDTLKTDNPRLIYCSLKGFLPGPYEHRTALDEVVQMMGGLAYMTGPPGKPTRAGAPVNDIMGAMFGVIAIQGALRLREATGLGQEVQAALFENNAFLVAPTMLAEVINGAPEQPWSVKLPPWPVYDLFETADGAKFFLGVVGDGQWADFCRAFGREDWLADPALQTNPARVSARATILPEIARIIGERPEAELIATCERLGLPFAPVRRPGELKDDVHLKASGGLLDVSLPDGRKAAVPALPIAFGGERLGLRRDVPEVGADTAEVLARFGLSDVDVDEAIEPGRVRS
jgi:crotonobetainyl-CoA:carnitine CoA-transferase CaiB-like acyl-CoA transferase